MDKSKYTALYIFLFLYLLSLQVYIYAQPVNKSFQNERELNKRLDKTLLFIDSTFVKFSKEVQTVASSPTQAIAVLKPEKPWEELGVGFSTVIKEKGEYRMYYQCHDAKEQRIWCLALSKNGKTWTRPNLKIVKYNGSLNNNILSMDVFEVGSLFKRVIEGKVQYVTMVMKEDFKHYFYTSPDGIHFEYEPNPVMPFCADTQNQIIYDSNKSKYVWYLRSWVRVDKLSEYYRTVSYYESPEASAMKLPSNLKAQKMMRWGGNMPPAINTELKRVMALNYSDPSEKNKDIYTSTVLPYGKNYFAFPSIYYITNQKTNDGRLAPDLYYSKDGESWKNLGSYVDSTLRKGYNQCDVFCGALLTSKDTIYNYMVAEKSMHGIRRHESVIYAIPQIINRYAGLKSSEKISEVLTEDFPANLNRLYLNFKTEKLGYIVVQLLDANDNIINETSKLSGNFTTYKLNWKRPNTSVVNKIKLKFISSNANLFALTHK